MKTSTAAQLRRLADEVLEAADVEGLTRLLTRKLPSVLGVGEATLLLWDRKLDTFEGLTPAETQAHPVWPGGPEVPTPEARYLVVEGALVETPQKAGEGTLLPLLARSGLAGMLALGRRRGRRARAPFRPAEVRWLSVIAGRAALALENSFYLKELVATERVAALGTMASMLAHDFRGPMTVIRGYAETLLDPHVPPAEVRARAELIVNNVDRLERMTAETLDFARGGGRLSRREILVGVFLQELCAGLPQELPGLQVVPHLRVPGAARGGLDIDKVRRAASNVAANARDAMRGAGRLHVHADLVDGALVLVLADEGPGVPEELHGRIFEPFVTHGKKKGTGLGLAVARRFVEDHGGTIELLPGPYPPSSGAAFRLRLPLTDETPSVRPGSESRAPVPRPD